MRIQPADIIRSELIGLEAEVVDAKNKSLMGVRGLIIGETKNTLSIERADGVVKKLIKSQVTINVLFEGQTFQINGKVIIGRPEDRLKKVRRIK